MALRKEETTGQILPRTPPSTGEPDAFAKVDRNAIDDAVAYCVWRLEQRLDRKLDRIGDVLERIAVSIDAISMDLRK